MYKANKLCPSQTVFGQCLPPQRVSLCGLGGPGAYSANQAGLELRDLPISALQVLGLKASITTLEPSCLKANTLTPRVKFLARFPF